MSRKKYAPSSWRRCAIFLALVGTSAAGAGRLQAGVATGEPSRGWEVGSDVRVTSDVVGVQSPVKSLNLSHTRPDSQGSASALLDASRPGMTGENWFLGVQQDMARSLDSGESQEAPGPIAVTKVDPAAAPGNATAIPSLPSFWSGITCCVALMVLGMFPRFRRAFR